MNELINLQFKFATAMDSFVIALGAVMALLAGGCMPAFMILRGFAVQVILFRFLSKRSQFFFKSQLRPLVLD